MGAVKPCLQPILCVQGGSVGTLCFLLLSPGVLGRVEQQVPWGIVLGRVGFCCCGTMNQKHVGTC